jgi:hypothetical protein
MQTAIEEREGDTKKPTEPNGIQPAATRTRPEEEINRKGNVDEQRSHDQKWGPRDETE